MDVFGAGDRVCLVVEPELLTFGSAAAPNLQLGSEGRVQIGGRRWKGDCLVDFAGARLWIKQNELEMVEANTDPRPSTAEEIKLINRLKARDRIIRNREKRLR